MDDVPAHLARAATAAESPAQERTDEATAAAACESALGAASTTETAPPTGDEGEPQGAVPFARTSKYDFVKVRIWQGTPPSAASATGADSTTAGASPDAVANDPAIAAGGGHYHVLSRYLVSRSLTAALVPRAQARRISLQCKKRLVDAGRLDVTQEEWARTLEQVVQEEEEATAAAAAAAAAATTATSGSGVGVALPATAAARPPALGLNMERFKMIQWFQSRRTPLLVFLYGTALIGTSALATKLCSRLDFSQVLQSENAYHVSGRTDEEKEDGDDHQRHLPLYLLPFSCEADLEAEYDRRCRRVRRALQSDVTKLLAEGRSVILEGSLIDPTLFDDLLPGAATEQPVATTIATPAATAPSSSIVSSSGRAPILISFHVHLPAAKHQLLLHNHFAATLNNHSAAAPIHVAPPQRVNSTGTLDSFGASPASSSSLGSLDPALALGSPLLPIAALPAIPSGPPSPPPSPALIWRNLRWLESVVARRHQQWSDLSHRATCTAVANAAESAIEPTTEPLPTMPPQVTPTSNTSSFPLSTPGALSSLTYSVSLDPLLGAVDSMHATVLQAMQQHHSERDQP